MSINIKHRGRTHVADHGFFWEWLSSCMPTSRVAQEAPQASVVPVATNSNAASTLSQQAESETDEFDWKTWRKNYESLWEDNRESNIERHEDLKLLKRLDIANDGGLNALAVEKLWSPEWYLVLGRYWGAAQMSICIVANLSGLIYTDLHILANDSSKYDAETFLLGKVFWEFLMKDILQLEDLADAQMVAGVELFLLALMVCSYAFSILWAFRCTRPCHRWFRIALFFWRHLPIMATFTAMKLLHYVDPWIMLHEFLFELSFFSKRFQHGRWKLALWKLFLYIFTRFVCFVVGLDAFLVKFRETSDEYVSKPKLNFGVFFGSTIFLFQVLAIVNLSAVVRNRVFFFVFGGPQCEITSLDKAKEWYWNAMLARKIWETHSVSRFLVIMLSFSDCDVQQLLLDQREINPQPLKALS